MHAFIHHLHAFPPFPTIVSLSIVCWRERPWTCVKHTKLLGVYLNENLRWGYHTKYLVLWDSSLSKKYQELYNLQITETRGPYSLPSWLWRHCASIHWRSAFQNDCRVDNTRWPVLWLDDMWTAFSVLSTCRLAVHAWAQRVTRA